MLRICKFKVEDNFTCIFRHVYDNLDVKHHVFFCRGKILPKRINVRVEHVKHSNCRLDFLNRVAANEAKKKEAKEKGVKAQCKRQVLNDKKIF